MTMPNLDDLLAKRHDLIPGAAHTYSKGDDLFPAVAPTAILRGKGTTVWGSDGKEYLDWCMGLRSVSLGHVYEPVNAAVRAQMEEGTNFGRPHPIEYEVADHLVNLLPNVEMVKFAKNGSTVTTAATKLARAYTGRKYIAVCANHPFFSYDDWFIGTTPCNAGIPKDIQRLTLTFAYNDLDSVKKIFDEHPGDIACLIMEVVTTDEPAPGFLMGVQELCKANGTVFILDEMITGFRFDLLGAVKLYGLTPDLVTYGKGIANGYSLAVLGGKKDILERGGIKHDKERVFLVSTTHGAETISLAAGLATVKIMQEQKVSEHIWKYGTMLKAGLDERIAAHGLVGLVQTTGFAPNLNMSFFDPDTKEASSVHRTIFLQEAITRGILFQGYFAMSFSHGEAEVRRTLDVFDEVMGAYKTMLDGGDMKRHLIGDPIKPVFRKYN